MSSQPLPAAAPGSRRDQILAAAAELFARHGFHGVGIDDIGAAVGISGPALYRHFRSKDAMLGEMLTSISEMLLDGGLDRAEKFAQRESAQRESAERESAQRESAQARTLLTELVRFHVDFALDNPALITVQERNLGNLADPDRRKVRTLQRRYVEVWVSTIQDVTGIDEPEARAAALAVFGLINSTPHSRHLDRAQMGALLRRMAFSALTHGPVG